MDEIFFSIVIPAYNASSFIVSALACINSQVYNNYEVIIIENGSTDNTYELAEQYLSAHKEMDVKIYRVTPNIGISNARNMGIKKANYDYVCFLDVDDIWCPNKLLTLNDSISAEPGIDVFCHWEYLVVNGEKKKVLKYKQVTSKNAYYDLLMHGNKISTSATTVRRQAILAVEGFSSSLTSGEEDFDCWLRMAKNGSAFRTIRVPLGEYHIHNTNVSANVQKHNIAIYNMLKNHISVAKSENVFSHSMISKIDRNISARYYYSMGRYFSASNERKLAWSNLKSSFKYNPFYIKLYFAFILVLLNK